MLEPDTHPPFDIMKGGRPLKKPKKAKKAKGDQEATTARQRVLKLTRNTLKKKVSNVRAVSQKRVNTAQQKKLVEAKKVESFKEAATVIKRNTSRKVLPKNVKSVRVSRIQKDALIKSKISGIKTKAKLDMDSSRGQLILAAKSRVRISKDLNLARTNIKLNDLVRQRMETRIPSTRKAVSEQMTTTAKNHGTTLELTKTSTSIIDKSRQTFPTEVATNAKIKQKLQEFPDKINPEKQKLNGHDQNRINAVKDIDGFKTKANQASIDAETTRVKAQATSTTLGDTTKGKLKEYNDLNTTIKNRPADPRSGNAQKAALDADGFKAIRDATNDPAKNGVKDKSDADFNRDQARKDSENYDRQIKGAKTSEVQKVNQLRNIQNNHDSFVTSTRATLIASSTGTVRNAAKSLTDIGKNRNSLKDQLVTLKKATSDTEGLQRQNGIDKTKRSGEVSDRLNDVGTNNKIHDQRTKDKTDINNKLTDLGTKNTKHKSDRDAAEGKLIPPKHDAAYAPDVARLSEIKTTQLPKARDDLKATQDRHDAALLAKERLPKNPEIPDLTPLRKKQSDLSKELENTKGIKDPAVKTKEALDADIRNKTAERNARNDHLSDLKSRVDSYSPIKPPPPKPDIDTFNDAKNMAIMADRSKSSKAMTDSAKKHEAANDLVVSKSKELAADASKLDSSFNDSVKLSIKKDRIERNINNQNVTKQGYDIDRKGAAADIQGFNKAGKDASQSADVAKQNADTVAKTYNDKKAEYDALDSSTSGQRKRIGMQQKRRMIVQMYRRVSVMNRRLHRLSARKKEI
jgi:hypothetical protein